MAFYAEEDDMWKCVKHPSKRRRSGVCPGCLTERLAALCPECANLRPCSCSATNAAATSTSSSASSSFSLHLSDVGSVGKISNLIDSKPSFRRSRSAAVFSSIFRSARFSGDSDRKDLPPEIPARKKSAGGEDKEKEKDKSSSSAFSIMSVFRRQKSRNEEMDIEEMKMRRSRSVAASITAENEMRASPAPAKGKGMGWYFPSPMKVFRHSNKASKVIHERSPLHRG